MIAEFHLLDVVQVIHGTVELALGSPHLSGSGRPLGQALLHHLKILEKGIGSPSEPRRRIHVLDARVLEETHHQGLTVRVCERVRSACAPKDQLVNRSALPKTRPDNDRSEAIVVVWDRTESIRYALGIAAPRDLLTGHDLPNRHAGAVSARGDRVIRELRDRGHPIRTASRMDRSAVREFLRHLHDGLLVHRTVDVPNTCDLQEFPADYERIGEDGERSVD